jgi:acyl-CoA synthetase (AMP-forming)/AMP-acid ligase II
MEVIDSGQRYTVQRMAPTAGSLLEILERGHAQSTAIVVPGGISLTYAQLREQVAAAADGLARLGVRRDERVALVLPNSAETIVMFLAAATAGAAAPLNPAYKEDEFRFYLEDTGARVLVVAPARGEAARRALPAGALLVEASLDERGRIKLESDSRSLGSSSPPAPSDDDVALVLHTSGTTSRPKLVPLRQRNLAFSAENIARTYNLTGADVALCVMPLFHIHGLMASTMATFASGGTVLVTPGGFDAMTFWAAAENHGATWYSAVPTMHQMLLLRHRGERPAGAAKLRFARSSSSALSPETMRRLESTFGAPVIEAYGMTEASHQMASNPLPPGERRPGTVGIETGIRIGVVDETGRMLETGAPGEVVIQGPSVIDGYASAEANATSFRDGWFRTGDQGFIDADGYLSLVGRLKEMINRGGEKIAPREIDDVLLQHPAVAEAVAFGTPHPAWGEEVAAAVVLRSEATEKDLIAFARERLADYKVPKKLYIVERIPRTATGKIQRRSVAAEFHGR